MNINSLQGVNAYANTGNAAAPAENTTRLNTEQQQEASNASNRAQQNPNAFEVSITQEARDRLEQEQVSAVQQASEPLAAEAQPPETNAAPPPQEPPPPETEPPRNETPVVDIIA